MLEKVQSKLQGALSDVKDGDLVKIDWMPLDGFTLTTRFIDQSDAL